MSARRDQTLLNFPKIEFFRVNFSPRTKISDQTLLPKIFYTDLIILPCICCKYRKYKLEAWLSLSSIYLPVLSCNFNKVKILLFSLPSLLVSRDLILLLYLHFMHMHLVRRYTAFFYAKRKIARF